MAHDENKVILEIDVYVKVIILDDDVLKDMIHDVKELDDHKIVEHIDNLDHIIMLDAMDELMADDVLDGLKIHVDVIIGVDLGGDVILDDLVIDQHDLSDVSDKEHIVRNLNDQVDDNVDVTVVYAVGDDFVMMKNFI